LGKGKKLPKIQILIYPWIQIYDFMLPSHIHYSRKDMISHSKFTLGEFMWYLLGVQTNITQEMTDIFRENRQTLFLTDKRLKMKYEEYLDIDIIPQKYKNGKSYYEGYKSLMEKNAAELNKFSKTLLLDKKLEEKISNFFKKEVLFIFITIGLKCFDYLLF
jgi:hypothetical protein